MASGSQAGFFYDFFSGHFLVGSTWFNKKGMTKITRNGKLTFEDIFHIEHEDFPLLC